MRGLLTTCTGRRRAQKRARTGQRSFFLSSSHQWNSRPAAPVHRPFAAQQQVGVKNRQRRPLRSEREPADLLLRRLLLLRRRPVAGPLPSRRRRRRRPCCAVASLGGRAGDKSVLQRRSRRRPLRPRRLRCSRARQPQLRGAAFATQKQNSLLAMLCAAGRTSSISASSHPAPSLALSTSDCSAFQLPLRDRRGEGARGLLLDLLASRTGALWRDDRAAHSPILLPPQCDVASALVELAACGRGEGLRVSRPLLRSTRDTMQSQTERGARGERRRGRTECA